MSIRHTNLLHGHVLQASCMRASETLHRYDEWNQQLNVVGEQRNLIWRSQHSTHTAVYSNIARVLAWCHFCALYYSRRQLVSIHIVFRAC